jgi:hypothetical protein
LVRKANAVKEETKWAAWLYHQCNQSIHVTDGVTVMSLPPCLLQKISATTDCLSQITLNWRLSLKFDKRDHRSSMPHRFKPKMKA